MYLYVFIMCVFFWLFKYEHGRGQFFFFFFWDMGFSKRREAKTEEVLLCCPDWSAVAIHQHNPTTPTCSVPTRAGSPRCRQPGHPLLPGGHCINATALYQCGCLISTAHYSPGLRGSTNPPASASQAAGTTGTYHLCAFCMLWDFFWFGGFVFFFFNHPAPFVVEIKK